VAPQKTEFVTGSSRLRALAEILTKSPLSVAGNLRTVGTGGGSIGRDGRANGRG
jgi:hypothetical protein